jgi:Conserved hypothetical protein 2217 (DUF2460)
MFILFPGLTVAATPIFPALPVETYPVQKTPVFAVSQARALSGRLDRLRRQCFPLMEFTIMFSDLRDDTQNQTPLAPPFTAAGFTETRQLLDDLYNRCLGQYGQFWYNDPDDNSRLGAPLATAGTLASPTNALNPLTDGTSTVYVPMIPYAGPSGLSSHVPAGGINTDESTTVHGTAISYSAGGNDGRSIVFESAPAAGLSLTADLYFYFRCHFTSDAQQWQMFMAGITGAKIGFRSVKV